ncbi:MAG: hypothetical protein HQM16_04020 [Deltaproteobacteria bacterium]|nr:hypothetical protein [Deltaproteobacteria bacterium]
MERKQEEIEIKTAGPVLPGSVTIAMAKCGKPTCVCQTDPEKRHGPYYRWTGVVDGKRTTITITEKEASECRRRIKNWNRFQQKLTLIIKNAMSRAPWNDR